MIRLLMLALIGLCLAGHAWSNASTSLSERLVAPGGVSPLIPQERLEAMIATLHSRSGHVVTAGGIPLFWRAIDPGDYHLRFGYRAPSSDHNADFSLDFLTPQAPAPAPRGTVILLHGWMMDGDSLLPWSLQLAQDGYRAISIDLRNHGRSGGGPAGYGTREADDVAAVIASLRERGEVQGPLYLFGVSYGAATALFTAQKLGDAVTGVVAMESFANAGRGIRDMVPHMLYGRPQGWSAQMKTQLARLRYGGQDLDAVIAAADKQLGLDLDAVDVAGAARETKACLLLIHGADDQHIPVTHGRALAAAAPHARYLEIAGENHISLPMRLDRLAPTVEGWLDALRSSRHAECPGQVTWALKGAPNNRAAG